MMMFKIGGKKKISRQAFLLVAIVALAAFIRLVNFDQRYPLGSDMARDMLVARHAVQTGQLPLVGPFSSAGPFVFSPNWYYFLMIPAFLFPGWFYAPWVIMFLISLAFVTVMFFVGKLVAGNRLGLILALLVAVSPQAVRFSLYLLIHGLVEIGAGLSVLGFVGYLKTGKFSFAFLAGLGAGWAISMHYSAINLLFFLPLMVLLGRRNFRQIIKAALLTTIGLLIPLIPMLYWDHLRSFKNLTEILYYFRVGQYRVWVSNRWLIYLGNFWPSFLGTLVGGNSFLGAFLGIVSVIITGIMMYKRKITLVMCGVLVIFLLQLVLLRYYRGEKFDGYLGYWHPTVFLVVGWSMFQISKIRRGVFFLLMIVIIAASLVATAKAVFINNEVRNLQLLVKKLQRQYPSQKFSVYSKSLRASNCSYTLSYLIEMAGLESDTGQPVGVLLGESKEWGVVPAAEIGKAEFSNDSCSLVYLGDKIKPELIKQNDWYNFTKGAVYADTQDWWRKEITQ